MFDWQRRQQTTSTSKPGKPASKTPPSPGGMPRFLQGDDQYEREAGATAKQVAQGHQATVTGAVNTPVVQAAPDMHRIFVDETIRFLEDSASFFADSRVKVDEALYNTLMNSWYTMVINQEKIIDSNLGGDKDLKQKLHTAYQQALKVLMKRAATVLKKDEAEIYKINRGRIPMWAWKEASKEVAGFSTPIPEGETTNAAGHVEMGIGGLKVTIKPDTVDNSLAKGAKTTIDYVPNSFGATARTKVEKGKTVVHRIRVTEPKEVIIQTKYSPSANAGQTSAYGRGTTKEDLAGAKVTPKSKTLGFHEGQHGMDFMQYLREHPVPVFGGADGMSVSEFNTANSDFVTAWKQYQADIESFSEQETDMVGTPKP